MNQRRALTDPRQRTGERVAKIADDGVRRIRNAVGMRFDAPFEYENVAFGKEQAKMIVGAAVAEAEFENRPSNAPYEIGRAVETSALRDNAVDEALEAALARQDDSLGTNQD